MKKVIVILICCIFFTSCAKESNSIILRKAKTENTSNLNVHYINIKNGKCTVFELPNGECMVIDTGTSEDFPIIFEYLKSLEIEIIDYMIITSNDLCHLGGAKKIMQNFTVHEMYVSKCIINKSLYQRSANQAVASGCSLHIADGGTEIYRDDDLNISIAGPIGEAYENAEDYSLSTMVSYGNVNFFVQGDCGIDGENDMCVSIGDYLNSDVISVANSATGFTTSTGFLQKISPKYAVIQVFGDYEPEKRIIKAMETLGIYVLRNDVNGNIVITSNMEAIVNIKTEK